MPSASRSPISKYSSATSPGASFSFDGQAVPFLRRAQPGFRPLLGLGRIAAAIDIKPAMGAGSDAGIFVPAPIDQIVSALRARPRMVGNLVSRQTGFVANFLREVVEIAREIVIGNGELAGLVQAEIWRVRLDGQLIERQMLGRFRYRALEFMPQDSSVWRGRA